MNKKLMTTVCMAVVLAGCTNDDLNNSTPDNNELRLTATVDVRTRANATAFESNDCIGLYAMAWTNATPSVQLPLGTPYYTENVKFKWDGTGFANQQTAVYWPEKNRKLDLYAYYPYTDAGIAEDNTLSVAVQSDQSVAANYAKSDFMTARLTGNERTKEALSLPFRHAMSKVKFTLVAGVGYTETELAALKMTLKQMNSTAKIHLDKINNEASFLTDMATPVDITTTSAREAILIPQVKAIGSTFFTLTAANGSEAVIYQAEEGKNSFEPGKQYNYTVKISRVGVNVTAEIMDWEVVDFEEIDRSQIIDLTTDIGGTEGEKAETFAENDVIGLFQKNGEVLTEVNQQLVWKSGKLSGKDLYWPNNGTQVTFYAYYPHTAGLTSTSLAAKVMADQQTTNALATSDVKTAVLTTDKSTSGKVIMTFHHAFSKVIVNLTKGQGFTDEEIAGMKVSLPQMKTTAAIDLTKLPDAANYILTAGDEKEITPFSANTLKTAMIVPQVKTIGSTLFAIKTAGGVKVVDYVAESGRNDFKSGYQYTFTIKLNRVGMNVNAEIVNWKETAFSAEAEQAMDLTANIGGVEGEKNETFAVNDKIGVYTRFDNVSAHNNYVYTWGGNGLSGDTPIYWPNRGTVVDIYAYYPYKASGTETGTTLIKTELPADQTTDAAYVGADVKTAVIPQITQYTNGKVILPFFHAFSRVTVTLKAGVGFTTADLEGCTVTMEDMYKETSVDIAKKLADEGYLTGMAGSQTVKMNVAKGAIIIPKTVAVGATIFTVHDREGNKMAIGKAATDKNIFKSGNQYNITLTLKKAGINVNAEITNWVENNVDMDGDQWLN